MLFGIVYLGFTPRIASESFNSAEVRLEKIVELIQASKFSIHDLSRLRSAKKNELARMNMPFELGIDYALRKFLPDDYGDKRILVLSEKQYTYQAALSDLAGSDIQAHANDHQKAVRKVRNWLVNEGGANNVGAQRILDHYADFQEWYYEKQLAAGWSDDDIQDYPTGELLAAMQEWVAAGMPV